MSRGCLRHQWAQTAAIVQKIHCANFTEPLQPWEANPFVEQWECTDSVGGDAGDGAEETENHSQPSH